MKNRKLLPDQKRTYEVKVRLNLKEKQKLDRIIRDTKNHAPDIFRTMLRKNKLPDAAVPILDLQTYYELRKLANNYNQYVKAIHQGKISEIDQDTKIALYQILEKIHVKMSKS